MKRCSRIESFFLRARKKRERERIKKFIKYIYRDLVNQDEY
jgi:hypothetical protein